MSGDEELGALLLDEIQRSRSPCTAADLARKFRVREERVADVLRCLCDIGIVVYINNSTYVSADFVEKESQKTRSPSPVPEQPPATRGPLKVRQPSSIPPQSQAVAIATDCSINRNVVAKSENQVVQYPVEQMELIQTEDAVNKILRVLSRQSGPMKSTNIAKATQLGSSKSAVNRFLYALESYGFLSKNGVEWTLVKPPDDQEVKVVAAQLAKAKRKTSSGGDSTQCVCPNRGGGCVHNHFTQNITNNTYNMQVGDHNNIYLDAGVKPKRYDASGNQ